jgi:hypothetical protein
MTRSRQSDRPGNSAQCPSHGPPVGCSAWVRPFPPPPPPEVPFSLPPVLGLIRPLIRVPCPSFGCCLHEPVRHFMSDTNEVSQVPCKDRLHVLKVSDCARFIPCKRLTHVMMLLSGQRNGVSTSQFDPFRSSMLGPWSPCERFTLILADSPCITRGRGGWLGLISWKTCTSYSLPASWRSVSGHPEPVTSAGRNVRFDRLK